MQAACARQCEFYFYFGGDSFEKRQSDSFNQISIGLLIVFLIYILGFARTMSTIVCVQANGALVGKVNLLGATMDTTADAT